MAIPLCPYFGKCGGCSTQHIDYEIELANKQEQVARAVGISVEVIADKDYAYRNRMDFIFTKNGLGFRKKGDWKHIVPITSCAISDERINTLLAEVSAHFVRADVFDLIKKTGTLKYALIRVADEVAVSFVVNQESPKLDETYDLIKAFSEKTTANIVMVGKVPAKSDMSISEDYFVIKGSEWMHTTISGQKLRYHTQGFFQNNHAMAQKLHTYVSSYLSDFASHTLVDLYAGVGAFGVVNAHLFNRVISVENYPSCVAAARQNAEVNERDITIVEKDAKQLYTISVPQPCVVITDPPRSGMHRKTITAILDLAPDRIVYVSCNVAQLKKELPFFKGYTPVRAAMCDLFPQTNHCEAVVVLDKA